ncbi:MAG: anion transporter [Bacteroidetes bacterium]|nr:MAG: anion transporter [Bacteroidota bacterium]
MKISLKVFGLVLGPVSFFLISQLSYLDTLSPQAWDVLGVGAWMVIWWVTEATPIAVAALLPIVIFPILGVFDLSQATAPYASPIIFLFMGGFFLALGLEEHGLHKRIALNLVKLTGTSANGIIFGFMLATGFLSMWISNTASTIMMLPIAGTVIHLIKQTIDDKKGLDLFSVSLMLGIAYSANIGGMATIIGTPPNVVFVGYAEELLNIEIDFSKWMLIGIPISSILLLITYFFLTKVLYRNNLGKMSSVTELIDAEVNKLGRMGKEEKMVATIFGLTASMWIFKLPINNLIGHSVLNDTATAMIGGILMFAIPVNLKKGKGLVPWEATKRLPWGILLLFGGGMTLAKAMETTGLIQIIANLVAENPMSSILVYLILISSMLFLTELMSNVALATIYIPVVIGIANGLGMNPLLLSIPVAMAASCAFMMPISTPPNAIVFSSGHIRMKQMIKTGFALNLISVAVLLVAAFTIIEWVFG